MISSKNDSTYLALTIVNRIVKIPEVARNTCAVASWKLQVLDHFNGSSKFEALSTKSQKFLLKNIVKIYSH